MRKPQAKRPTKMKSQCADISSKPPTDQGSGLRDLLGAGMLEHGNDGTLGYEEMEKVTSTSHAIPLFRFSINPIFLSSDYWLLATDYFSYPVN
jgi:hypothetical protein